MRPQAPTKVSKPRWTPVTKQGLAMPDSADTLKPMRPCIRVGIAVALAAIFAACMDLIPLYEGGSHLDDGGLTGDASDGPPDASARRAFGPARVLVSGQQGPRGVAIDDSQLFWTDFEARSIFA